MKKSLYERKLKGKKKELKGEKDDSKKEIIFVLSLSLNPYKTKGKIKVSKVELNRHVNG